MVPVTGSMELPERLLLIYKPEEAEQAPEPVPIVEEEPQVVEEPAPVLSSSEITSPPPRPEIADTGDLPEIMLASRLSSKSRRLKLRAASMSLRDICPQLGWKCSAQPSWLCRRDKLRTRTAHKDEACLGSVVAVVVPAAC